MIAWIITLITLGITFAVLTSEPRMLALFFLGVIIVAASSALVDFTHKGN